jgi:serine/threonine protein phosphatase 1
MNGELAGRPWPVFSIGMRMFSFLRPSTQARQPRLGPPSLGENRRVYAVGDIHGRLDLLREIIDKIAADDWSRGPIGSTQLILLGDYVDRGADSARVIDFIIYLSQWWPDLHCLMGNHEEVFLMAAGGDEGALRFLLRIGGRETLISYGLQPDELDSMELAQIAEWMAGAIPESHLEFIAKLEDKLVIDDYLFVHAGVRPEIPTDQQNPRDLRWIRDEFLAWEGDHDQLVIHGHSISEDVEICTNRIGIDTGAYATGRLTAIGLQGTDQWFLQTGG